VNALGAHFSGEPTRMVNLDAYDAFLLGRYHVSRSNYESATERLTRAIELDPTYAEAYAALAQVYGIQVWLSPPNLDELASLAEEFIDKALQHDPNQPLALGLRAMSLPTQTAIDELDALVRRYPNDPDMLISYSIVLRHAGRVDLEIALLNKSVALDPLSPGVHNSLGGAHMFAGHLEAAKRDFQRSEELGMPNPNFLSMIALLEGDLRTARQQVERPPSDWAVVGPIFWQTIFAAYIPFSEGDFEAVATALKPLDDQLEALPFYPRFVVALLKGETELALVYFQSALEQREPYMLAEAQGSFFFRTLFPQFFNSEGYHATLREHGLDEDSLAKLKVPPLPV
jgi:Flp pilus assembly protein TadD